MLSMYEVPEFRHGHFVGQSAGTDIHEDTQQWWEMLYFALYGLSALAISFAIV
jgi:hypothetical protein